MHVKEIGTRIREIRKEKGLSQIEVAKNAKIAVNSLRLYESNKRQPSFEKLLHIADALGVDVNVFFDPHITLTIDNAVESGWRNARQFYGISNSDPNIISLLDAYNQLNNKGQQIAVERVEELSQLKQYKKENPLEGQETASDGQDEDI